MNFQWTERGWHAADLDRFMLSKAPTYSQKPEVLLRAVADGQTKSILWQSQSLVVAAVGDAPTQ